MKLRNCIELILYKSYTDLRAEAARSYLGLLWWLIEPVLYLCAFYVLFVLVLQRGQEGFVPFFLCGAVVWKWFDSSVKGGANSISTHRGLFMQVYVPKFVFPIIAVMGSTARFIPVFFVFILFLLIYGYSVRSSWSVLPVLILVQFLFVLSIAMLVGAVTPFLPDLKVAIDNGMMLLFFVSGVFFDINGVHDPVRGYLLMNPMAVLIDDYRTVLIGGGWPDFSRLSVVVGLSVLCSASGYLIMRKYDHSYGKVPF